MAQSRVSWWLSHPTKNGYPPPISWFPFYTMFVALLTRVASITAVWVFFNVCVVSGLLMIYGARNGGIERYRRDPVPGQPTQTVRDAALLYYAHVAPIHIWGNLGIQSLYVIARIL